MEGLIKGMKKKLKLQSDITPIYLDEDGYKELLVSIEEIKKKIVNNNKGRREAYKSETSEGWVSAEFEEIERVDNMLMGELHRKYEMLSRVVIVQKSDNVNIVNLGDIVRVSISSQDGEEEQLFKIIGGMPSFDMDAEFQEISINSPAGYAIYQKNVGETCSYSVNNMKFRITVLEKVDLKTEKNDKVKKLKK